MKKPLIVASVFIALLSAVFCWRYASTRHPQVNCGENSCTFSYVLCKPVDPAGSCEKGEYRLMESIGPDTNFMPWPKRQRSYKSVADLRFEAEQRADIIENVKQVHELDAPP